MSFGERVLRKKLYKAGKSWVIGGSAAMVMALAMASVPLQSAFADDATVAPSISVKANQEQDNTVSDKAVNVTTEKTDTVEPVTTSKGEEKTQTNDSNQVTKKDVSQLEKATQNAIVSPAQDTNDKQVSDADKQKATSPVAKDSVTDKEQAVMSESKTANIVSDNQVQTKTTTGKYVEKDGQWSYAFSNGENAKGLTKIDNHTQYFDENGVQVKGKLVTVAGKNYYLDPDSGDAVTGVQRIDNQVTVFNTTGEQVTDQFYQDTNGATYYLDETGKAAVGLKTIDGHNYYFDSLGQIKKGFSGVFDGKVLYFDKATGQEVSANTSQIKEGLVSQNTDYTQHNAAHSTDKADFENIDGYLTATSWYRPTDILRDGTHWEASKADDFRPILSVWWPDKQTQVNYLNYMSDMKLVSNDNQFKTTDDQVSLNEAANYVQKSIETKISLKKSVDWLKEAISAFVVTQPQWNQSSEDPKNDHLQNGALTYVNSPLTPDANSNFRLLNRTPTNQTGTQAYNLDNSKGGFELLLANDVDNSNPVVQAEQLNWLHYLMNFGSITANDDTANFDGIRVDAVDNVDADLLQIAADYFKLAYGVDKNDATANQHLSILEDWSHNDPLYVSDKGNNQLTMDDYLHTQLIWSLTKSSDIRGTMQRFVDYYMVNRKDDHTENEAIPNYSFVRAHDSEVQTVIAQIVSDLYPDVKNSLAPTEEQLAAAFKIYNEDQKLADKKYTQYNMASAYAMLLTNKDTVPRVYYGDLYTDDGQYMATKSPYFDAINTLLKARVKYVAGGQSMSVDQHDILTSVRYGKGAMTSADNGTSETRNEGVGTIVSNNKDLTLNAGENVILHMGAAHKNQAYRALLSTTESGLNYYDTDNGAPIRYTDGNGDLIFGSRDVYGVQNPQVSGFLSVWVPLGADANQDARTTSDQTASTDGKVFHSNAGLDSQVIYEGFSNFQAFATQENEFTNAVIAQNGDLFKQWGITSFQLAPQYRSSTDTSFLDSIIQNGYAFTDRYDLGYKTPTKYGTDEQLRDAIKALHTSGIQAIADWVPDQIYNLPEQELATVTRTNSFGDDDANSDIDNALYVVQSRGGGEYQARYGGAFLDQLRTLYPSLFKTAQISTGVPIDPTVKIKEWSAKYFNGSNIQGKGEGYVLKDSGSNAYYKVTSNDSSGNFLPKQLTDDLSSTGFTHDNKGIIYYTLSGYRAQNTFVQDDNGNYYYFDNTGHLVTGLQNIKNHNYFFLPNGIELVQSFLQKEDGSTIYFGKNGQQVFGQYIVDQDGIAYYFDDAGNMLDDGFATIDGHKQYFDQNGVQVKGEMISDDKGRAYYLQSGNGNLVTQRYMQNEDGQWFYFDANGVAVTGMRTIDGMNKYFYQDGHQSKGNFLNIDGQTLYTDPTDGHIVTGVQTIDGEVYAFGNDGVMLRNQYQRKSSGQWLYLDDNGKAVKGFITQNNQLKYFDANGEQVKDGIVTDPNTQLSYYFNGTEGAAVKNDYYYYQDNWYYADKNYQSVKGFVSIDGYLQHFDEATGIQTKQSNLDGSHGTNYSFDDKGNAVRI